ncbi:hypothetical protein AB0T83_11285 [Fluviibacterium sp. DFM31]|uniref:Outer membrane protein beta-barrel domain-containing protein n=1 Tax=Meridianimarinicoccus marinus TaxID=3231483 RepID=A0ABV3L705_9RHOB
MLAGLTLAACPATAERWTGRIATYYWQTGLAVDSTLQGAPVEDYEGPFSEIGWYALPLVGELRYGRHSFWAEFIGVSISDAAGPYFGILDPDMRLYGAMSALAYGYAFHNSPTARAELVAGARYWDVNFEMDLGPLGRLKASERDTVPFVGVYGEAALSDRWQLAGTLTAGGYSAGAIDTQFDLRLDARYRLSGGFWATAGYRHLQVGFDDPAFSELRIFGPTLGLEWHF